MVEFKITRQIPQVEGILSTVKIADVRLLARNLSALADR